MLFSWKLDPHPPLRNANNIEPYTFVTLFSRKLDTPHPHLRYVTLKWPPKGVIQVLRNAFPRKLDPHPPPHNANNVVPYIFVTLFSRKCDTPRTHPHMRYVTPEWPAPNMGLHAHQNLQVSAARTLQVNAGRVSHRRSIVMDCCPLQAIPL